MTTESFLFKSFLQAGFECSTHKRRDGSRLDLLKSTGHERFAATDFELVKQFGMRTVRECARWYLIESSPGEYRFDSLDPLLNAANEAGTEVLLDLLHFGWPDHVNLFASDFAERFAKFTFAVAGHLKRRPERSWYIAPVNEISFLSWAGGEKGCINPYLKDRATEIKHNLVRAAAAASEVLLNELPRVRLFSPEPVIHIIGNPDIPGDDIEAENYRLAQYESWDMISGRLAPELRGRPEYLDILGINFYDRNEWVHNSEKSLPRTDPRYKPFRTILQEVWERYRRPMFISETGTEDGTRASWFGYVCDEVAAAMECGIPIHGICLYPIVNHPGWEDDRHCHNGLFDYPDENGARNIHWPLAHAVRRQQRRFARTNSESYDHNHRPDLLLSSSMGVRVPASAAFAESLRSKR